MVDKDRLTALYENTSMTQKELSAELGCSNGFVSRWAKDLYTSEYRDARNKANYSTSKLGTKNPMKGKFKKEHPRYRGVVSDGKGYNLVLKPPWFTGKKGSKHIFEHHFVFCSYKGITEIPKHMSIHHVDGNKTNNRIGNLVLLSKSAHTRYHAWCRNMQNLSNKSRED